MTLVLCDPSFPLDVARAVLEESGARVVAGRRASDPEAVVALLACDPVTGDDLRALSRLRVVATPNVGVDHVDVEAATERGVWVCNVPDYCVDEVADHALALLLALVRGVVELDRSVRAGGWSHDAAGALRTVSGLRLGIVGFGRIGRALASRARALGMEVTAHDPYLADDEIEATGARPASLERLLRTSDAVSLHVPLTPATRGLLGRRELELLPEGAYLVNVSRGGLVETEALLEALAVGRLAGAALDVLEVEPPTDDAPAPRAPRLVVTPHAAWYSPEAEERVYQQAAAAVLDVLAGRRP
ncbi:MAG: C-terminal binding protein, partial [Thermoleophilia bacterium]|nr:C-terminal binding protein [Gaiellaceae bacterium]MDW8338782.1 C-terminal binding protein [Thermoleophilia bacterium]